MATQHDRQAQELSAAWDRLIAGQPGSEIDPALADTLLLLSEANDAIHVDAGLQDSIWANVVSGTSELWKPGIETRHRSENHNPVTTSSWTVIENKLTRFAWIVAAGFIGGFIAGIGSRLTMRLAGFLTPDYNRMLPTENDARVGEITLDGTMSLGLLGAAAGIVTVLIYLGIRNRLPFDGWRRSGVYAVLLLLVFGYVVMDPSNPDYELFGPTWLNVSTFSSLYLLLGFSCSQVYELGSRWAPRLRAVRRRRELNVPFVTACAAICAVGVMIGMTVVFIGAAGLIVVAVGGLAWLADRYVVRGRIPSYRVPAVLRPWGMLVVPGIIGFILTARGITEILLNR